MKIETSREALLGGLNIVSGVVLSGNVAPIWQNVLFEVKENILTITAANQETQIKTTCEVKNSKEFSVTVAAAKLRDILSKIAPQTVVKMEFSKEKVTLSAAKSVFNLAVISADDFTFLSGGETERKTLPAILAKDLLRALRYVQYASAQQSHRMSLNGVLLDMAADGVWLVATDGHRMALEKLSENTEKKEFQAILPRKSAAELARNLSTLDEGALVEVDYNERTVRFSTLSFELISNLIDEKFPDYREVVPRNNDKTVKIEREELRASLERVSVMGERKATVIFNLSTGDLQVSCTGREKDMGSDSIPVEYKGEEMEIGFNVSFLLDMLKEVGENVLTMKISEPSASVLFATADEKCYFRYVVMPIRL